MRRGERELDEELRFHAERRSEELQREAAQAGTDLSAAEARRQALVELGGAQQIKEEVRAMRTGIWIETLWQDLRYAARSLRRNPAFLLVALLTLALGIGANTAVFSLLDTVLLKQLPVRDPQQLVLLDWIAGRNADMIRYIDGHYGFDEQGQGWSTSFSYAVYQDLRRENQVFDSLVAYAEIDRINAQVDGHPDIVYGQLVSGTYFTGLGVPAFAGRMLGPEDDAPADDPAVVLSYRYWQRRFGGDRAAIGKIVYLNASPFTIVGVTPPGFGGALQVGYEPEVTAALAFDDRLQTEKGRLVDEGAWFLRILGRLKPGVAREQVHADLAPIFRRTVTRNIPQDAKWDIPELRVYSGAQGLSEMRSHYATTIYLLWGGVGLVLLVACANVATLMLMRSEERRKEVSVRMALGAQRGRLMRQVLVESVLLSLTGGGLGLLFAYWGKNVVVAALPIGPSSMAPEPALDARVLLFTLLASLLTGLLFGLAPAVRWSRGDVAQAIKGTPEARLGRSLLVGKGLIALQVGLSVILLVGAGVLGRTLIKLHEVRLGFDAGNVLLARVNPALNGYQDARLGVFYATALERLRALPGVESVALVRAPLVGGRSWISSITVPGYELAQGERPRVLFNTVSEDFLATMRIPLLAGRFLAASDHAQAPPVAVINSSMARKLFRDERPLGHRFTMNGREIEVVGVVADVPFVDLRRETEPAALVPYRQYLPMVNNAHFVLRTRQSPLEAAAAVREALRAMDPNVPLFEVRSQEQQIDLSMNLAGLFGGLALVLVCVGVAGLLSYEVSRRTREIGIRMALGGQPGSVGAMVVRQGLTLTALGLAAGLAAAVPLVRYMESVEELLFQVRAFDVPTYLAAAVVLLVAAAAASWIPARRATRVDPMLALRHE
jgi:predicted permease